MILGHTCTVSVLVVHPESGDILIKPGTSVVVVLVAPEGIGVLREGDDTAYLLPLGSFNTHDRLAMGSWMCPN